MKRESRDKSKNKISKSYPKYGYKVLNTNMGSIFGDGMKYELNKEYGMPSSSVIVGRCGYHYYETIDELLNFIHSHSISIYDGVRLFKVKASGNIEAKKISRLDSLVSYVYAASCIKLIEEVNILDIYSYIASNSDEKINNKEPIPEFSAMYLIANNPEYVDKLFYMYGTFADLDMCFINNIKYLSESTIMGICDNLISPDNDRLISMIALSDHTACVNKIRDNLIHNTSIYVDDRILSSYYRTFQALAMHHDDEVLDFIMGIIEDRDTSSDVDISKIIAMIGRDKDLDILINHSHYLVREQVIKHGRIKDLEYVAEFENNDFVISAAIMANKNITEYNIVAELIRHHSENSVFLDSIMFSQSVMEAIAKTGSIDGYNYCTSRMAEYSNNDWFDIIPSEFIEKIPTEELLNEFIDKINSYDYFEEVCLARLMLEKMKRKHED